MIFSLDISCDSCYYNNIMRKELIMKNNFGLKFHENCEPTEENVQEFADYCMMFYGENNDDALYPTEGFTMGTAMIAINEYLTGNYPSCEENIHLYGGGDTIDREKVLGIFLEQGE